MEIDQENLRTGTARLSPLMSFAQITCPPSEG